MDTCSHYGPRGKHNFVYFFFFFMYFILQNFSNSVINYLCSVFSRDIYPCVDSWMRKFHIYLDPPPPQKKNDQGFCILKKQSLLFYAPYFLLCLLDLIYSRKLKFTNKTLCIYYREKFGNLLLIYVLYFVVTFFHV